MLSWVSYCNKKIGGTPKYRHSVDGYMLILSSYTVSACNQARRPITAAEGTHQTGSSLAVAMQPWRCRVVTFTQGTLVLTQARALHNPGCVKARHLYLEVPITRLPTVTAARASIALRRRFLWHQGRQQAKRNGSASLAFTIKAISLSSTGIQKA